MKLDARRRLGSSAVEVTILGFGGAPLGNLYDVVSDEAACKTVERALALGVGYFDTAPYYGYGLSEERLGRALSQSDRAVPVVSTKVGRLLISRPGGARSDQGFVAARSFEPVFDYGYDGVMRSFEASLARLGVDRIDILLMHDIGASTHGEAHHPSLFDQAMREGYRAMDELRSSGAVGALGLGVNECEVCLESLDRADLDCFLLAGRYTLLEQGALDALLPRCVERGVSVIVGGPFNSGVLVEGGESERHYDYGTAPLEVVERVSALREVCRAHRVDLPAAALQFPLRHPAVAAVIPGARTPGEVEAQAAWMSADLPAALYDDLKSTGLIRPDAPTGQVA